MNGSDISITENTPLFESTIAKRVIMVGGDWAKGDDLFLLVAKEVVSRDPSVHFYWLGSQSLERKTVNQGDIDKLAIASHVHFLPHTSTSHDVVKAMDVFALTSRSDSFPLAAIEAGLLGIPIVCFEKASVFNSLKYGNIDTKYRDLKLKMLRQYKKLGLIIASDWIYNKITRLHLTEDKHIFRINYPLDVSLYKNYDKKFAEDFLMISEVAAYETKTVLLFSGGNLKNKRKGFDLIFPL